MSIFFWSYLIIFQNFKSIPSSIFKNTIYKNDTSLYLCDFYWALWNVLKSNWKNLASYKLFPQIWISKDYFSFFCNVDTSDVYAERCKNVDYRRVLQFRKLNCRILSRSQLNSLRFLIHCWILVYFLRIPRKHNVQ